jgi:hypothetical protein
LKGTLLDTPPYHRESVSFAAGNALFGGHGPLGVDSKPSRRAVRRTQAPSGEWPGAPDARPESLERFFGHHGIDPPSSTGKNAPSANRCSTWRWPASIYSGFSAFQPARSTSQTPQEASPAGGLFGRHALGQRWFQAQPPRRPPHPGVVWRMAGWAGRTTGVARSSSLATLALTRSTRPGGGEEAIGQLRTRRRPRRRSRELVERRRRRDSTAASLPHAPPAWPVMGLLPSSSGRQR